MKNFIIFFCIFAILFFAVKYAFTDSIPQSLTLEDAQGNKISLTNLEGKAFGVIGYFSNTPCKGHMTVLGRYRRSFKVLRDSSKYKLFIVYGDSSKKRTQKFVNKYDIPILMDPGKKLAQKYKFDYYAVIIYNAKGEIFDLAKGVSLNGNKKDIRLLDHILKTKGGLE